MMKVLGRGRRSIINLSWADPMEYAVWLSRQTKRRQTGSVEDCALVLMVD